jgi:imidazolonepropionase-like amidohydrolase
VQTPVEQLQSATSVAATVLNQEGKLGVIAPGAYADLIVVDGDPTQDITVMCEPERNFVGIMKAGKWEKAFAC